MNGSVMPLAGIRCRLTAMLIADCMPNSMASPAVGEARERVVVAHGAGQPAQHDEGEQRHQNQAQHDAEFLGADREHEIGMAVRQDALDRALARAAAEPAAAHERFQRHVDLEGVARGRIEEALDAARDVRNGDIGAGEPDRAPRRRARPPRSGACRP